ncbi:hypothetical protein VP01_719g2 [Puccinia sorghi]|uniref:Uncharacterized protein n=1 Tax=Puccinia sorghi TaxID=27349 RepID=A0A0L6UDA8_9BASI|nr:hypothetical protein VP01_719g2 [Puccinia sorghi]
MDKMTKKGVKYTLLKTKYYSFLTPEDQILHWDPFKTKNLIYGGFGKSQRRYSCSNYFIRNKGRLKRGSFRDLTIIPGRLKWKKGGVCTTLKVGKEYSLRYLLGLLLYSRGPLKGPLEFSGQFIWCECPHDIMLHFPKGLMICQRALQILLTCILSYFFLDKLVLLKFSFQESSVAKIKCSQIFTLKKSNLTGDHQNFISFHRKNKVYQVLKNMEQIVFLTQQSCSTWLIKYFEFPQLLFLLKLEMRSCCSVNIFFKLFNGKEIIRQRKSTHFEDTSSGISWELLRSKSSLVKYLLRFCSSLFETLPNTQVLAIQAIIPPLKTNDPNNFPSLDRSSFQSLAETQSHPALEFPAFHSHSSMIIFSHNTSATFFCNFKTNGTPH